VAREDITKLLNCAEVTGQYRWAPAFAFSNGQRKRAVQLARWEHLIDWDTDHPLYLYANDKAGREDIRPASPFFVEVVRGYVAECFNRVRPTEGYIFADADGQPFNKFYDWRWSETKAKAGITGDKRWHDLRSGFVSNLVEAGLPIHDVAYLARHTDASLTAKAYAHADRNGVAARLNAKLRGMGAEGDLRDMRPASVVASEHVTLEQHATEGRSFDSVLLASPGGFEPPTFGLGNHCSILLSYEDFWSPRIACDIRRLERNANPCLRPGLSAPSYHQLAARCLHDF